LAVGSYFGLEALRGRQLSSLLAQANEYLLAAKYDEALHSFDKVLRIKKTHIEAIVGKGKTYLAMGNNEAAEAVLQEAVHFKAPMAEPYHLLHTIYMTREDLLSALGILEQGYVLTKEESLAELRSGIIADIAIVADNGSPLQGQPVSLKLVYSGSDADIIIDAPQPYQHNNNQGSDSVCYQYSQKLSYSQAN